MKRKAEMNRIILGALSIACCVALPLFASDVTIARADVSAGDKWTESSTYGSDINLTIDNGMGAANTHSDDFLQYKHQSTSITRTKNVEVTSVNGQSKIVGLIVGYTSVVVTGNDLTSLFQGNRYAIDIDGNHVGSVTYADGTTPSDTEISFVRSDNSNVGQIREMRRVFGGKSLNIGDSLRSNNPDDLFDVASGFSVDDFQMTLASVAAGDNPVATFTVSLSISSDVKKPKGAPGNAPAPFSTSSIQMSLSGPLLVDANSGRIISFSFNGPATASGQKQAVGHDRNGNEIVGKKGRNSEARSMSITGDGTATLGATFTYQ